MPATATSPGPPRISLDALEVVFLGLARGAAETVVPAAVDEGRAVPCDVGLTSKKPRLVNPAPEDVASAAKPLPAEDVPPEGPENPPAAVAPAAAGRVIGRRP
ncbi:hypothetical protein D9619_008505 [Psilocybe cf. subviscida]|uniref:Uncharacterized protein n=1 Tax=Psilocybe cf. subviscida TaxID=2480587 RepID=A0A8H5F0H8_9AGAR|nr:hypothetical protein D9619_008505 [Psilocybe cf. subviscida]